MNQPRILLAEDDPVSREFLVEALRECGAEVDACADGPAALALARSATWDLLLLDHHLPGLSGDAVLAALSADRSGAIPAAIAITAEADADRDALLHAGFAEVLPKPIAVADLRHALQRHGCATDTTLDDDDALRACGSAQTVTRLRRLFIEQEIPAVLAEVERCSDAPKQLRPTLHRLRASCGFCGARSLDHASAALHRALASDVGEEQTQAALAAFLDALAATRSALNANLAVDV
ncbi:MAG TPA: response regulator [Rhodanobacteraceae bacterium]|nr:response regulator [Rhodanobacteraceae bacterium]